MSNSSDNTQNRGRTAMQLQQAPQGAVFVWVNDDLRYPKNLAHVLGRDDLQIVSPRWLQQDKWRGRELTGIVIDHAAELYDRERYWNIAAIINAKAREVRK